LEHVAPAAEALHEAGLQLVDQIVVAAWIVAVAAVLVARGEIVVVGARGLEVVIRHPVPYSSAETVKPGDHPDFYRFAPPPGASRESTIVLDREGRFRHDGEPIDHAALEQALRTWIARHPDDGRLILTNGYDWCYFRAEGAPFFVDALR